MPEGGFSDTDSSHNSYLALVIVVPHSASSVQVFDLFPEIHTAVW